MIDLPTALTQQLRDAPDDPRVLSIFTDWLGENGFDDCVTWLVDQRSDMAALFRVHDEASLPFETVRQEWLTLRNGLPVGFTLPRGQMGEAVRVTAELDAHPLAVALTQLNAMVGRDAKVWLPLLRRRLRFTHVRLGPDVDLRLLEGFTALRNLEVTALLPPNPGTVMVPPLRSLTVDVRGQRLDVLNVLQTPSVATLELTAPNWNEVPSPPLEAFFGRVEVGAIEVDGTGAFHIHQLFRDREHR